MSSESKELREEEGGVGRVTWKPQIDVGSLRSAPSRRLAAARLRSELSRQGLSAEAAAVDAPRVSHALVDSRSASLPRLGEVVGGGVGERGGLGAAGKGAGGDGDAVAWSPLHAFPSPLSMTHVRCVRDLLQRTYSAVPPGTFVTPVDRVARNYTPTAQGLTMRQLLTHLGAAKRGGAALARVSASGRSSHPLQSASTPLLPASKPALSRATAYPSPMRAVAAPGRGRKAAKSGVETATAPKSPDSAPKRAGLRGVEGKRRAAQQLAQSARGVEEAPTPLAPEEERGAQERAVSRFWAVVEAIADDSVLAAPPLAWEDAILDRLGVSEGPRRHWVGGGAEEGSVPLNHVVVDADTGRAVLASGISPADLVEQALLEAQEVYFGAVRRTMVEYDLKSPNPRHHHAIDLRALDAARFFRPPLPLPREQRMVSRFSVPARARSLSRFLFVTEQVMGRLSDIWYDPIQQLPSLLLVHLTSPSLLSTLPLSLEALQRAASEQMEEARRVLKGKWHRDSVEAAAGFVLELKHAEDTQISALDALDTHATDPAAADAILRKAAEHLMPQLRDVHAHQAVLQREAQRLRLEIQQAPHLHAQGLHVPSDLLHAEKGRGGGGGGGEGGGGGGGGGVDGVDGADDVGGVVVDAERRVAGWEWSGLSSVTEVGVAPTPLHRPMLTADELEMVLQDVRVGPEDATAVRLEGALAAVSVLMSRMLQSVVLKSVADLHSFFDRFPGPEIGAKPSQEEPDAGLPPEEERTPALRVSLELAWGHGGSDPISSPTTHPTTTSSSSSSSSLEDVSGIRGGPETAPPIGEVHLEGCPLRGQHLQELWAGDVRPCVSPGWDVLESGLAQILGSIVEGAEDFSRAEVEIKQYTGDKGKLDEEESGGGGEGLSERERLTGIARSDERVVAAREAIASTIARNRPGPDALCSRFEKFCYLFGADEKRRLVEFANDPSKRPKDYADEFEALEAVAQEALGMARDVEVFALVQVDTSPLRTAIAARARLLATALSRTLKEVLLARALAVNARFRFLDRRLRYQPADSEELVAHGEFSLSVADDLAVLGDAVFAKHGLVDCARVLHYVGASMEMHVASPAFLEALCPEQVRPADIEAAVRAARRGRRPSLSHPVASSSSSAPAAAFRAVSSAMGAGGGGGGGGGAIAAATEELGRATAPVGVATGPLGVELIGLTLEQGVVFREALSWFDRIRDARQVAAETLEGEKRSQLEKLEIAVSDFDEDIAHALELLEALNKEGDIARVADVNRRVAELRETLEQMLDRAEQLNHEQELLEVEQTDWTSALNEALERIGPHERTWKLVEAFLACHRQWYRGPLLENNPEEADKDAEASRVGAIRAAKELPEAAEATKQVAARVRRECEQFINVHHPLLTLMANPGLKERHWEEMAGIVGRPIPHSPTSTLSDMIELGLEKQVEDIEETCVNASKEYSLEKALDRMKEDWQPLELELKPHKDTGTHIMTGNTVDEVQALLDDHIVKAQTMASSRYAKPLLAEITEWIEALQLVQNVLDQWIKVQTSWLYLEPIFSSEDIMRQMPTEGNRFKVVDTTWRRLMKGAVDKPLAMVAMQQPGMLEALEEANHLLDLISKGLNSYLETKRLYFPRFFFLSNDELLEILAETKDPLRVQPHLKKCFEGIKAVKFDDDTNIVAMVSSEGEVVDLEPREDGKPINPHAAKGNVEVWLEWLENSMRRTVARIVDDGMRAYPTETRTDVVRSHPGQAVLAFTQTYWTRDVEEAIREDRLDEEAKKLADQINDIIMLVRGDLTKLERKTLSALTVLDVHARDVTQHMVDVGVRKVVDFEWNSQLRYYWEDDGYSRRTGKPGSLTMKMINAELLYAGEYLGNSGRLVITPLTDRCYRTLMGAIYLQLGGAPEGPAGTGKTETVKDLAKAAGMMCVVFNCSDQLGVEEMAKFFKGLASSGAWSCFDEFNRIDLEVLSVVAQQIMDIQLAKREKKETFVFYGTEIKLTLTANAFITMNPGYAGRSELPDNLKALFRTVAMMVPDYAMIAEIILYSFGYLDAKALARKIVATYKLCSEQLSSQDHYDYGMRAVMAVLRAAGNLKAVEKELPEDVLMLRAIIDVNLPKFLSPDIPLFNGIVSDLFPGVEVPPPDRDLMRDAVMRSCTKLCVQPEPVILEKVFQVYEMMLVRHGFMLVGMPWSAKTISMKLLQQSMRFLHDENPEDPLWTPMHLIRINPKSLTMGQLYGKFDDVTKEWTNGVLSNKFRDAANGKIGAAGDRQWMVFDGPVDAIWIENMNTVLDDNKKLCLMSGEIIAMSDTMSMVFETKDLAAASPATVSRCGMVYFEPHQLGWKPIVASWLERLAEDNPRFPFRAAKPVSDLEAKARSEAEQKEAEEAALGKGTVPPTDDRPFTLTEDQRGLLQRLFHFYVDPALVFLRKRMEQYVPAQDTTIAFTMCNLIETSLSQCIEAHRRKLEAAGRRGGGDEEEGYEIGAVRIAGKEEFKDSDLVASFLFALVWGLGGTLADDSRVLFDEFVREMLAEPAKLASHKLSIFFRMSGWDEEQEPMVLEKDSQIPAKDSIFDYVYGVGDSRWRTWESVLPRSTIPSGMEFSDILVPTEATAQFDHLVPLLALRRRAVLACGPTGTGKSVLMKRWLEKELSKEEYLPVLIGFSAQTSANQTQQQVDQRLDRRRKGVYGPQPGMQCMVFVDDLNMPQVEEYGAQPPIELLRQLVDHGGWYNLEENSFMKLEDTLLLAAMGPPGGGRNTVTPRILRHLNSVCFTRMGTKVLRRIFTSIVDWFVADAGLPSSISAVSKTIVPATLEVYSQASSSLRPTPAKSHYTFNLRDFSKVVQGICLVSGEDVTEPDSLVRLWVHECLRVFHDRLTDDTDRSWIIGVIRQTVTDSFGKDPDTLLSHLPSMRREIVRRAVHTRKDGGDGEGGEEGGDGEEGEEAVVEEEEESGSSGVTTDDFRVIFWGDFVEYSSAKRRYREISDAKELVEAIEGALEEYNSQSKKPMDLVAFLFFLEHVSRLARVLKMSGGHLLLVGVGGSGRQCATRLASFMANYKLMQVELSKSYGVEEWREDLKEIMREAGTGPSPVSFFFSDTQIKWTGMVEDINNILNSGEVPNLFAIDEKGAIYDKVAPLARAAGRGKDLPPAELWAFFVERMKANLHVVLAMSPIGDAFRDRLRKFPSLVSCTTIDWFSVWPADALQAVAQKHLNSLAKTLDASTRGKLSSLCKHFHKSVRELSEEYRSQARRHNYVTPTSYLELLSQFKKSLLQKQETVSVARDRYVVGLEKLDNAATQVAGLQRQLEDMQPVLKQSQEETQQLMEVIQERLPGVQEMRGKVKAEADIANADAEKVAAVKAECEADLAEAMPALNSAISALDTIRPDDIRYIRGLANPPELIRLVMSAVLDMLDIKPEKVKDPDGGMKKIDDYWGPAKRALGDHKAFLERMKTYDKDNIEPRIIEKVRRKYIGLEHFTVERAGAASPAAAGMCAWVRAMDVYERVAKVVAPKRAALAEAEGELETKMAALREKEASLKKVEDELAELQSQYDAATKRKEELEAETELCRKKLIRAEQLIGGLGGEKERWTIRAAELSREFRALTGDVLLAAGIVSYLGPFTMEFRTRCIRDWQDRCLHLAIPSTTLIAQEEKKAKAAESGEDEEEEEDDEEEEDVLSLASVLGDPIKIREWRLQGLPTDAFSTDNAVIVAESRRWPLMIDPQGQANKWVKNMQKDNNLCVLKQTDQNFLRSMENAIQFGQPVVLENVGEEIDPSLEPVLLKILFKQGASWCIRLGDATVEYDERFKLYITTKLRNPHYLPEVSTKVTLLNFMITPDGLEDQLLGVVVAEERPDLQELKAKLLLTSAENQRVLSELESKILHVLSTSKGNILEDETAISVLNESKKLANEVNAKQKEAEATEAEIDTTREGYTPVAAHASRLFFVTQDLGNIDPMYQYSMTWFSNLFVLSIRGSKKSDNLTARIAALNDHFTFALFKNVCRSLFEKDKLLFSFILCIKLMMARGELDRSEWLFLLTGGVALENPHPNPAPEWLGDKSWGEVVRLSDIPALKGLRQDVESNIAAWKMWFDSEEPHRADLPGRWGDLGRLTRLQRLLVLRCLRPDKVMLSVQDFVAAQMGEEYLKPPPFDLKGCHMDSHPAQPLVFVLSPGSDPMAALLSYAEQIKTQVNQISLGQGQGKFAEEMIEEGRKSGSFVVLQNCHLSTSWMPALEKICEDLQEAENGAAGTEPIHRNFRLWLTSYPSKHFPVSILQNGIKMTKEPPKGLRANLMRSFLSDPISDPKFFNGVSNAEPFRRMLYALSFFHAMVQDRRQFGPLGWNIPYEFNESDLRISAQQVAIFLNDPSYTIPFDSPEAEGLEVEEMIPYATLRYLVGECNYGGRVTDDKDRRCLLSILAMFFTPTTLTPSFSLSPSGDWCTPPDGCKEHKDYIKFIETLPAVPSPEVFGMHPNATITKDLQETTMLFGSILLTETTEGGGKKKKKKSGKTASGEEEEDEEEEEKELTRDEKIAAVVADVLGKVREPFDLEEVGGLFPVDRSQSMNTVLTQELSRFNRLIVTIRTSLVNVQKALKGLVVMSQELEEVANQLFFGKVPQVWMKRSYPSLKPLGSYVLDLSERLGFFQRWIERGSTPLCFPLPVFFFTHSFLTASLQNYARATGIAIDELELALDPLRTRPEEVTERKESGELVHGIWLDGASFDMKTMQLADAEPKQLFAPLPMLWLKPRRVSDKPSTASVYPCPAYMTSERRGVLRTTGHSSNFLLFLPLPSPFSTPDPWIRRGVAALMQLDD